MPVYRVPQLITVTLRRRPYLLVLEFVHRYRVYQLALCEGRLCDVTVASSLFFYNKELAVNLVF